jgi:hypothetical protein
MEEKIKLVINKHQSQPIQAKYRADFTSQRTGETYKKIFNLPKIGIKENKKNNYKYRLAREPQKRKKKKNKNNTID